MKQTIALCSMLLLAAVHPASAALNDPIPYVWQDLTEPKKAGKLLLAYSKLAKKEPNNLVVLEKIAMFSFAIWRFEKVDNRKRRATARAVAVVAKEMMRRFPDKAAGYHWAASALGMLGLTQGALNSLQMAPQVKALYEKSIELEPDYLQGSAYLQLGRMYTMLPGFYGGKELAKDYLHKARKIAPRFSLGQLYLADLYWSVGQRKEALDELTALENTLPETELERVMWEMNKAKAIEVRALILSGAERDTFYDVLSDIRPGFVD